MGKQFCEAADWQVFTVGAEEGWEACYWCLIRTWVAFAAVISAVIRLRDMRVALCRAVQILALACAPPCYDACYL